MYAERCRKGGYEGCRDAIEVGGESAALVESINATRAERDAARAVLSTAAVSDAIAEAEIYAMIDSLGDVRNALNTASQSGLPKPTRRWA